MTPGRGRLEGHLRRWRSLPITDPRAVLGTEGDWSKRNGARVPTVECLSPSKRVSPKKFAALMRKMGFGAEEVGA